MAERLSMQAQFGSGYDPSVTTYDLAPPAHWSGTRESYAQFVAQRPMEVWDELFAAQVLAEAQRLRKLRKLSARDMSERLTRAGWPLTINSVNGMLGKKGRVSISVPQILALADALEVAPIDLMFPADPSRLTYRLRESVTREMAIALFTGATREDPYDVLQATLIDAARSVGQLKAAQEERNG